MQLLLCTICPKQPTFSDTSHLLTHVGSKGHLAHLHKLQVRSHQEIAAGHKLALYNQWYQQHGLGRLLSERMQQKESRIPRRRISTRRTKPEVNLENIDPKLSQGIESQHLPSIGRPATSSSRPSRRPRLSQEDGDEDYSPSKARRPIGYRAAASLKASSSEKSLDSPEADTVADSQSLPLATPDNARLKGVVWPGMDLFDAATADMRRKRNQKKDGSILKQMQITSEAVAPYENVYSPGGTLRKERHIDDLEDASSLVEGETPATRKQARRGRQPLGRISSNVTRSSKRRLPPTRPKKERSFIQLPYRYEFLSSSPTPRPPQAKAFYAPSEAENEEFRLLVGGLPGRSGQSIRPHLNDASYTNPLYASFPISKPVRNNHGVKQLQDPKQIRTARPVISQSQYHGLAGEQAQGDSIQALQTASMRPYDLEAPHDHLPFLTDHGPGWHSLHPMNPLTWKMEETVGPTLDGAWNNPLEILPRFGGDMFETSDPFSPIRNPLVTAHFYDQDDSTRQKRHQNRSPNGTLSDTSEQNARLPGIPQQV